ncbi:hypothetical protein HUO05_23905 (plasmid) [Vibrio alginolyticus]|uniref:hypothetical protein n=1 Tax=Vibrio alginolyticus TaxID=663 RepID=UPI001594183A|nr:hypothetical protein [Vibrio alginolyticus]QKS98245.1 hypothetical protein HUO05_23905 [Vibrio alginolyticus]
MSLVITLKGLKFSNPNLPVIPLDYPMEKIEALYRMDSLIGSTIQDSSGNGNHATTYESVSRVKEGVRLDKGYINTPVRPDARGLTVFAVHRMDVLDPNLLDNDKYRFVWSFYGNNSPVSGHDQVYYAGNDGMFKTYKASTSAVSGNEVQNVWVFSCLSFGDGRYRYFCPQANKDLDNGVELIPEIDPSFFFNIGTIGQHQPGESSSYGLFEGEFAVVGVYHEAKTRSQIEEIYKAAQMQMSKRGIVI